MLLSFTVRGFASYKEPQTLFLTPKSARVKKLYSDSYHIVGKGKNKQKVMKSAVIFGGNATGKTNLLLGLQVLQWIVRRGNLKLDKTEEQHPMLFALNDESNSISFIIEILGGDNKVYTYEIEYNQESIIREALFIGKTTVFEYELSKGKEQNYNDWNLKVGDDKIPLDYLKTFFSHSNSGLVYVKKLEGAGIEAINIFRKGINTITILMSSMFNPFVKGTHIILNEEKKREFENEKNKLLLINLFQKLDPLIIDFEFLALPGEEYHLVIIRENQRKFIISYESEGIKKIYTLALYFLEVLRDNRTLLIDELDSSISARSLLEIFLDIIHSDNNKGQLVVTTHNISLFNNVIFDPQQIYICDRQEDCASTLEPLSVYKGVDKIRTSEKLMKKFLQGRFGGIHG